MLPQKSMRVSLSPYQSLICVTLLCPVQDCAIFLLNFSPISSASSSCLAIIIPAIRDKAVNTFCQSTFNAIPKQTQPMFDLLTLVQFIAAVIISRGIVTSETDKKRETAAEEVHQRHHRLDGTSA